MTFIPIEEAGTRLTVNLSALQQNYRDLAAMAPEAECAPVIKADAYGLGAAACGAALYEVGARTFFVAHITEAKSLLSALPGATVYILSGFMPGTASVIAEIGARPVLGNLPEIEEWAALCASADTFPPAALHVDTGINRLGLSLQDARDLANKRINPSSPLAKIDLSLIMSHLACADEPDNDMNSVQRRRFIEATDLFPGIPRSLANSAAILQPGCELRGAQDFQFDLVRPGIALFGLEAIRGIDNPMQTVATLEARVLQVRDVKPNESIGYGATYSVYKPRRIAILSIGYADGYFRSLGAASGEQRAFCAIRGQRVAVVGRVSMDMIAIDVTEIEPDLVARGALVEIFGPTIPADELADLAGTIGYEILTPLGGRFNRVYLKNGKETG